MAYTTIDDPSVYFQTVTYSGNETARSITLDGNSDLQPDWVWFKQRNRTDPHILYDSVRGTTKELSSNVNTVEHTNTAGLTAFNTDGFTIGDQVDVNRNSTSFVAWCWKESTTAGFDIIAYEGTGSSLDVAHNLSAVPDWIMIKDRDVDQAWRVYSKNLGFANRLVLSENGAKSTNALGLDADPTSSVINIGTGTGTTNTDDDKYIIYAFKNIQGFSKFSSYVGSGSAPGTFSYLGFKPAFLLIKEDGEDGWGMYDNKRNFKVGNTTSLLLQANDNGAESNAAANQVDFLSNGFVVSASGTQGNFINQSGRTYIYMAFAENPLVTSTGIPTTAR